MTVGQRIAQKRKELGLSQEALGERLGVSRQAIYKWESDAALPEIEKLVNLSREFSVSIDWLLGEGGESRELTPDQLRMVEEIVGRYLAAQPSGKAVPLREAAEPEEDGAGREKPGPPRRRRWPQVLAVLGAAALAAALVNLFVQLEQTRRDYQNLQYAISNVTQNVNNQIGGIASRVESILQSQNALTAEQSARVVSTDYRANTVTIEARVMPRTYVEGMTAEFILVSGGESFTVPGELGENHAFTAQITGQLSDEITVSAALLTGDQRQTQVLEEFFGLYFDSFPTVNLSGGLVQFSKTSEAVNWTAILSPVDVVCYDVYGQAARLASLRVGLFRDQKLVAWFLREEGPDGLAEGRYIFRPEPDRLELEPDSIYCIAAVAEDEFGREWVSPDQSSATRFTDNGRDHFVDPDYRSDPADWDY